MGFSLINHPFWGIPIYGTPHINLYTQGMTGMTGMTMFGADFRDESSKVPHPFHPLGSADVIWTRANFDQHILLWSSC